jgi:hypothetical protein
MRLRVRHWLTSWQTRHCHRATQGGPDDSELKAKALVFTEPHWTLFFDRSSCRQYVGAGVLLLTLEGEQFKYMVHLDFKATNNMAEYEALVFGLSNALSLGVRQLLVKCDSQVIIKQVKGECSYNDPQFAAYLLHAQKLVSVVTLSVVVPC